MIYQTEIYLVGGIYQTEEKELLISLGVYKEADFTRRKSFEEWYLEAPEGKVNITLPMLFKLATLFDVEVGSDCVELRSR